MTKFIKLSTFYLESNILKNSFIDNFDLTFLYKTAYLLVISHTIYISFFYPISFSTSFFNLLNINGFNIACNLYN